MCMREEEEGGEVGQGGTFRLRNGEAGGGPDGMGRS